MGKFVQAARPNLARAQKLVVVADGELVQKLTAQGKVIVGTETQHHASTRGIPDVKGCWRKPEDLLLGVLEPGSPG